MNVKLPKCFRAQISQSQYLTHSLLIRSKWKFNRIRRMLGKPVGGGRSRCKSQESASETENGREGLRERERALKSARKRERQRVCRRKEEVCDKERPLEYEMPYFIENEL